MADGPTLTAAYAKRIGGFEELGRRLGVTGRAAQHYAEGTRAPRQALQAKLADLIGEELSWPAKGARKAAQEPAQPPQAPSPAKMTAARILTRLRATAPTREQLESLAEDADALLVDALADEAASFRDRGAVVSAKRAVLKDLGEFRGEAQVTEAQVLRSVAGQRVLFALFQALQPYPEACRTAADALERLEAATAEGGKP